MFSGNGTIPWGTTFARNLLTGFFTRPLLLVVVLVVDEDDLLPSGDTTVGAAKMGTCRLLFLSDVFLFKADEMDVDVFNS